MIIQGPVWQSLLVAAQLAGVSASLPTAPTATPTLPAALADVPKPILRLSLKEIAQDQDRAFTDVPIGRTAVAFALGFDPEAELWVKVRQQGQNLAFPRAKLETGVEADLPAERYKFLYENGAIRFFSAYDPQSPHSRVSVGELLRNLYNAAQLVVFSPVEYAVVYEPGGLVPASICLLRRDQAGTIWITHKTLEEMATIRWFLAINGMMTGMRLEGQDLVFYNKPVPPSPPAFADRALR